MIRVLCALPCLALLAQPAIANGSAETCRAGLDRALGVMEGLPLMKEEMATGLMWLRLDAETALKAGDAATCLDKLEAVNTILGLDPIDDGEGSDTGPEAAGLSK